MNRRKWAMNGTAPGGAIQIPGVFEPSAKGWSQDRHSMPSFPSDFVSLQCMGNIQLIEGKRNLSFSADFELQMGEEKITIPEQKTCEKTSSKGFSGQYRSKLRGLERLL